MEKSNIYYVSEKRKEYKERGEKERDNKRKKDTA